MTEYQAIIINGVEYVAGTDRSADYDLIFKKPPTDKTILDLGCYMGYYSIRAVTEGARHAVGIDTNVVAIAKGLVVTKEIGITKAELLPWDFWEYSTLNKFDIVLCLSVLHHFSSIDRVHELLDRMDEWSLERMVFTVRVPDNPDFTYSYRVNDKGNTKLDLGVKFFEEKFPKYKVTATEAPSYVKRHIIDIRKV
jgi:cyclopropane fatty-acyl-phospholipid synthase-like methyltransferase